VKLLQQLTYARGQQRLVVFYKRCKILILNDKNIKDNCIKKAHVEKYIVKYSLYKIVTEIILCNTFSVKINVFADTFLK